jgi:acyl phosphate:glycerol-3-phosphate acyltransferase
MVVVAIVLGYLFGTLPSADLVTRVATRGRVDIRAVGSGNPGALNAMHSLGAFWGAVVLVLDLAKGIAAGLVGRTLGGADAAYLAGSASVAGHVFPVWTGFRGGKGVATSAGACIAVFPIYVPLDLVVAVLGAFRSRRAVVGTQIACAIWVAAAVVWTAFGWPNLWGPEPGPLLVIFAILSSAMILWAFADAARRAAAAGAAEAA